MSDRAQTVQIGSHMSSSEMLNIAAYLGCMLNQHLFRLYIPDCFITLSVNILAQEVRWIFAGNSFLSIFFLAKK